MPDWTKAMQQSFEYYTVEPTTLADVKRLNNVKKASFSRDAESQTLGSATIDVTNSVGESYIRGYLKTVQNGVTEKFPLGTVLSQTPSSSFNGKVLDVSMDCYTPLIELKEKSPPLGYTIRKGTRIMDAAHRLVSENCRVPVNKVEPIIKKSKNLIPYPYDERSKTQNGITFTVNDDGTITVNGTATAQTNFYINSNLSLEVGKTYVLSCGDETQKQKFIMRYYDETGKRIYLNAYKPVTWKQGYSVQNISITLYVGQVYDNVVFKPMLNEGDTAIEYEAYGEPIDYSPILQYDFVAEPDDTYLSFIIALIANAQYELGLGERGDIMFLPKQDIASLQPVWTFDDSNSSILYPEISINHDLYGVPNVVEVIYSYGNESKQAIAKNEDPNSPTSIVSRGRIIPYRDTRPSLLGYVTQEQVQDYAERLLKELSTVEYTVSFTHAYCPVRLGDCVRLNYTRAGITNIKAKVISQNINAVSGCSISTRAKFTSKLWR